MTSTPCATRARSGSTGASTLVTIQVGIARAPVTTLAPTGVRRWESTTIRTGERASRPGRRTVEQRIVGENGSDADHDRVRMGAHEVNFRAFAVSPVSIRRGPWRVPAKPSVRAREFDGHGRPPLRHPHDVAAMEPRRLLRKAAGRSRRCRHFRKRVTPLARRRRGSDRARRPPAVRCRQQESRSVQDGP